MAYWDDLDLLAVILLASEGLSSYENSARFLLNSCGTAAAAPVPWDYYFFLMRMSLNAFGWY